MLQGSPLDASAVRDTIARVFEASRYDRSARRTLGDYVFDALGRALNALVDLFESSASVRTVVLWLAIVLVALVAGRFISVAIERARGRSGSTAAPGLRGRREDALAAAQRSAAEGDYLQAAHYLYEALLQHLSRRGGLRLHSSKTAGDYARDLRARSSPASDPFRRFIRAFEYVVYGRRDCDRDDFDRLRALAEPLLRGE